jgi:hypothetical protein
MSTDQIIIGAGLALILALMFLMLDNWVEGRRR